MAGFDLATISNTDRVDLYRYMGYGSKGIGVTGFWQSGWALPQYSELDLRLNSITKDEYNVITDTFLPKLRALEQSVYDVNQLLLVDAVSVFKRNPKQLGETQALYTWWRMELLNFLGLVPGPGLPASPNNAACTY